MENGTPFAASSLSIARSHLSVLFDAYRAFTGLAPTYVGALARGGDPKFYRSYLEQDFGFRSYDTVVSRFSAVWPADLPWPADVPRQAPAAIDRGTLDELTARLARAGAPASAYPSALKEPSHG
jgi:hypothetical protein